MSRFSTLPVAPIVWMVGIFAPLLMLGCPPRAERLPPADPPPPRYDVTCRRVCTATAEIGVPGSIMGRCSPRIVRDGPRPIDVTITTTTDVEAAQLAECIAAFDEPTSATLVGRALSRAEQVMVDSNPSLGMVSEDVGCGLGTLMVRCDPPAPDALVSVETHSDPHSGSPVVGGPGECPDGQHRCGGDCFSDDDADHCMTASGICQVCPPDHRCDDGRCVAVCQGAGEICDPSGGRSCCMADGGSALFCSSRGRCERMAPELTCTLAPCETCATTEQLCCGRGAPYACGSAGRCLAMVGASCPGDEPDPDPEPDAGTP